jgi:hypothetical protein
MDNAAVGYEKAAPIVARLKGGRTHKVLKVRLVEYWEFRLPVGGGEKGYQFGGRDGASGGVTLWPVADAANLEEADCFCSQAGFSSLLARGVR